MASSNLDTIRFVTQHFKDLQGLRYWAPLGLMEWLCSSAAPH